jgi:hypothetical protein
VPTILMGMTAPASFFLKRDCAASAAIYYGRIAARGCKLDARHRAVPCSPASKDPVRPPRGNFRRFCEHRPMPREFKDL